jgi:predicted DNA-binding protein (MmcQ/YjbR family)
LWCKAPRGFQALIIGTDAERYFVPPYVGQHGWIGIWLDSAPDWDSVAQLVRDSYRMTAPKRLVKLINAG